MKERKGEMVISTSTILRIFIFIALAVFLYAIRDIVVIVLAAMLVAALIDPFADWFEYRKIPRGLAVIIVYIAGLGLLTGAVLLVVPPMTEELRALATQFAPYIEQASGGSIHLQDLLSGEAVATGIDNLLLTIRNSGISGAVPQLLQLGSNAFSAILAFFLVLILAFYLIVEKNALVRVIAFVSPAEYQPFLTQLFSKMRERLGGWLRGQLVLMFCIFVLTYIVLLILGIPYALVLALTAGLLEVVPFLGPCLAALPGIVLGLGISPIHALLTGLAYFFVQQLESNLLVPKIMQRATGLNPLVSLLALLIGWRLGGIVGTVLAIPLSMAVSVLLTEIWREREA